MGLSIDGPAFLHDLHRKTRQGKSTHAQAVRGAKLLEHHGIPFHVIAVVSADGLDHASDIFRFFEELAQFEVGFNVEELEGCHSSSSLVPELLKDRIERFWMDLYTLYERSAKSFRIREFERAIKAILTSEVNATWLELAGKNDQVLPFRILSVDYQGRVSTFSPELLGVKDGNYEDFIFGHVKHHDLADVRAAQTFNRVANDVMRGVQQCARSCEFFSVCGGGAPSNKYFENGNLSSTSTMYCRTSIQLPVEIVLKSLENKLKSAEGHREVGPKVSIS
jgi:uncharacterized protein